MSDLKLSRDTLSRAWLPDWQTSTALVGASSSFTCTISVVLPSVPPTSEATMRAITTYEELLREGRRYLGVKNAYPYTSALDVFREFVGDALSDPIDPRVRHCDEPALLAAFQQMGRPLEQARSKRSMVKRWSQALEVAELFGGRELELPEKLRLLLRRRQLSQRQLARRVRVDETTVRRWMQGEGWRSLGPTQLYKLEEALQRRSGARSRRRATGRRGICDSGVGPRRDRRSRTPPRGKTRRLWRSLLVESAALRGRPRRIEVGQRAFRRATSTTDCIGSSGRLA